MRILVLNAGSSSQKCKLYAIDDHATTLPEHPSQPLWEATADWTKERDGAELRVSTIHGKQHEEDFPVDSRIPVIERMLRTLWKGKTKVIERPSDIAIIGHRIVHGGLRTQATALITPAVKQEIQWLAAFAPLHNPASLEGIEACERVLGRIPQATVFDTAFHSQFPPEVAVYPGPYSWFEQGIRHYGFHGISHQYCARRSAQILGRELSSLRIVNCHLGNGCSLAAIKDGHSIDTTMGFTPLDGLMMGSRSGSIDPSILIYLQRTKGYSADQLDEILNKESGLKGISGVSSDLRQVLQAIENGNERARLALDIYIYRLRYFIGAMIASLGGIDVLTFTGGVGENAAQVRARTCEAFGFLNLKLDPQKNAASPADQDIAAPDSSVRVLIVHTEEDWEIARECWHLLKRESIPTIGSTRLY
ncbi:MAG: acetate kinase [Ktedonobacteraceae bacterium]|nr:acetate kinase [Ktedonobacteraceae bacterium]